ncbi:TolC family protein [Amphritea opalescens]|uniref:TolC family protein n=1 Tax=Amphritea opalescens TaxID=2490544 RepID=UPI0013DEC41B|nr:TolC family protein [Amphritea opalescens]
MADLVNLGLSLNPRVHAAVAELNSAKVNIEVEEGGYWPSLSISAGPENGLSELGYDLALTQMLYDWGETDSKVDVATAQMKQKIYSLLMVRSDVSLEVIEASLDIALANKQLTLVGDYTERLKKILSLAEKRMRGNFSDRAELSRVRQAISYAGQQQAFLTGELKDAEWRYMNLLHRQPTDLPLLTEMNDRLIDKLPNEESIKKLIDASPKYMEAREDLYIAVANVQTAQAAERPNLVLQAQAQRREIDGELTDDSSVAVRFQMELGQGLSNFKRTDMQRIQVEAAQWNLDSVALEMERDIYSNKESVTALYHQQNAIKEQLQQTKILIHTYQAQFNAGLRTIEELLSVERENYELISQLVNNIIESYRLPYRSASALGILPELLIEQKNTALN